MFEYWLHGCLVLYGHRTRRESRIETSSLVHATVAIATICAKDFLLNLIGSEFKVLSFFRERKIDLIVDFHQLLSSIK